MSARATVVARAVASDWQPHQVVGTLFGADDVIWLDSSPGGHGPSSRARWSMVMGADGPCVGRIEQVRGEVRWLGMLAHRRLFGEVALPPERGLLSSVDVLLDALDVEVSASDCPFQLGWAGYLGYETDAGELLSAGMDAALLFVDRAVVIDHEHDRMWLLALLPHGDDAVIQEASDVNRAWLDQAAQLLGGTPPAAEHDGDTATGVRAGSDTEGEGVAIAPVTRAEYEEQVQFCRERIRDGDAFQVCLTTTFDLPPLSVPGRELDLYRGLRTVEPVPFGAFLRIGGTVALSRSPERFLAIGADGRMLAEPIKGTRPRGRDTAEDDRLRRELAHDEKERAENIMIVDLLRNDLARSAGTTGLRIERLCAVESYASVHQLVSSISAELGDGPRGAAVSAAFPPGSMTGAPKSSGTRIARALERRPRGVYSGAIGYFSLNGAVDLSVVIRTFVGREAMGTLAWSYGAGGAVTWQSSPDAEAREVIHKSRPLLAAVHHQSAWEART